MANKNSKSYIHYKEVLSYTAVPIELLWWEIYGTNIPSLSATMGYLWNGTVWISHIIPIYKEDRGNVSLLWDMYGEYIPIALPYDG